MDVSVEVHALQHVLGPGLCRRRMCVHDRDSAVESAHGAQERLHVTEDDDPSEEDIFVVGDELETLELAQEERHGLEARPLAHTLWRRRR